MLPYSLKWSFCYYCPSMSLIFPHWAHPRWIWNTWALGLSISHLLSHDSWSPPSRRSIQAWSSWEAFQYCSTGSLLLASEAIFEWQGHRDPGDGGLTCPSPYFVRSVHSTEDATLEPPSSLLALCASLISHVHRVLETFLLSMSHDCSGTGCYFTSGWL